MIQINLIRKVAWSFNKTTGIDFEELFGEAALAYCEGLRQFDKSKNIKQTTFLYMKMENHLKNFINKNRLEFLPEKELETAYTPRYLEDVTDGLSTVAAKIVNKVLQQPENYTEKPPKMTRGIIVEELRNEGYKYEIIWETMKELKTAF